MDRNVQKRSATDRNGQKQTKTEATLWNRPNWDRVGIELMASQLNPNFYNPEPQPTTHCDLVNISRYSYLN